MKYRLFLALVSVLVFIMCSNVVASSDLVVDKFEISDNGSFPNGWESKQLGKARSIYKVKVENGNAILCVHCENEAIAIGKKIEFDLKQYPVLKWRWKVLLTPNGGDERHKKTGDSAAALYVVFPNGMKVWNPKAIKYVWSSSSLPKHFTTVSPYASNTKIVILENSNSPKGVWVEEEVNLYEDYIKFFGKKVPKAKMIGLMSDSDNTCSEVHACYDDIVLKTSHTTNP